MTVKRIFQTSDGKTFKTRVAAYEYDTGVQVNAELSEWLHKKDYFKEAGECYRLAEFLYENRTIIVSYLTRKPIDSGVVDSTDEEETL